MLWNQSESVAIYQNVGIVKHVPGGDFGFGLSSYLNNPEFIEVWNETAVQYTFSYGTGATYLLDTARHNLGVTQGSVDVFTAALGGSKDTTLFGFSSTQTNAAPAWELTLPGCSADNGVGGTYIGMEASDSGNALAFQCVYKDPTTGNYSARAYLVDGQGGNATWSFDVTAQYGVKAGQGQIQITGDGSYVLFVNQQGVPTPNTAEAYIIGTDATGNPFLRGNITIPFFVTAAISDSGDYVAVGDESDVHVYQWDAPSSTYKLAYSVTPPAGSVGGWIPWDLQMSTGPDNGDIVIAGCISGDVRTVQITAWDLTSSNQVTNWVTQTNTQLQENPSLRADGPYIGVSLWGDAGELPTVVLLQAGSNSPVFTYTTPGSMFAIDVLLDSTSPTSDTVVIAAAGKHVPANSFGNGGDAFGWSVVVPK